MLRQKHLISLRLKIQPALVEKLDQIRTTRGLSMNEAVNLTLANALDAKDPLNDRNNPKD